MCSLCGQARDTRWHRLWECPDARVVQARADACPQWFVERARRVGANHLLFTNAWAVLPVRPRPTDTE
eukprot:3664518-Karenia_brevis.AAC.1